MEKGKRVKRQEREDLSPSGCHQAAVSYRLWAEAAGAQTQSCKLMAGLGAAARPSTAYPATLQEHGPTGNLVC